MKKGFTGKRYFYWLGSLHARQGRPLSRERYKWPYYARKQYVAGWAQ